MERIPVHIGSAIGATPTDIGQQVELQPAEGEGLPAVKV